MMESHTPYGVCTHSARRENLNRVVAASRLFRDGKSNVTRAIMTRTLVQSVGCTYAYLQYDTKHQWRMAAWAHS